VPRLAGFSLVEVLVALVLVGLIVSAAAAATGAMRRIEVRVDGAAEAREAIVAAERVFRAVVAGAFPEPPGAPSVGAGAADRLTLTSRGPAILALDRPWPMTLAIVPERRLAEFAEDGAAGVDGVATDDAEPMALVLVWRDPDSGAVRREVVLSGARGLRFFFFDDGVRPAGLRTAQPDGATGAGWRASWSQPALLPRAVLLRADLPALGGPVDIAVHTVPTLPDACLLLPHVAPCAHWRGR
jgi:prepilin-type N-terminal cleavage/methylation domain-containing protein